MCLKALCIICPCSGFTPSDTEYTGKIIITVATALVAKWLDRPYVSLELICAFSEDGF